MSATWNTTKNGQSSVVVAYLLDGGSLGSSKDSKDFYVVQSLQDGINCNNDYTDGFASLNGLTEPSITGTNKTTTNLLSIVDWPRGTHNLCLRIKLMLQMSDGNDLVWHQLDFLFSVDVTFDNGFTNVILGGDGGNSGGGSGLVGDLPTPDDAADTVIMDDGPTYPGVDPTFDIYFMAQGPFPYGTEIPFLIEFHHPMDIFTYNIPVDKVLPMNTLTNQPLLDPSTGKPIALRSAVFTMISTDHATGIKGMLTITLPLILFQMKSLSNVGISIPVEWASKSRRRLGLGMMIHKEEARLLETRRKIQSSSSSTNNNDDTFSTSNNDNNDEGSDASNPATGSWRKKAMVKLELLPYEESTSGGAGGSHYQCHPFHWILVLVMGWWLTWDPWMQDVVPLL